MEYIFGFNVFLKPIEEFVEYAFRSGLKHLEIDLIADHSYLESFTPNRISNLKKLVDECEINLSLHTPYSINPADRIEKIRYGNVDYLKECVNLAEQLNATHITTHIGFYIGLQSSTERRHEALERLVLSLEEIIQRCEEKSIKLALENVNALSEFSEFSLLGDNINDFAFLYSKIDSPLLNMCLDIGHANITEGVIVYIEHFKDKIINVHFHDNMGEFDQHLNVGDGTVPWEEVGRAFKKINYNGPFLSECFHAETHEAKEAFLEYLK